MSNESKPLGHGFLVILVVGLICWVAVAWVRRYFARQDALKRVGAIKPGTPEASPQAGD